MTYRILYTWNKLTDETETEVNRLSQLGYRVVTMSDHRIILGKETVHAAD